MLDDEEKLIIYYIYKLSSDLKNIEYFNKMNDLIKYVKDEAIIMQYTRTLNKIMQNIIYENNDYLRSI